MKYIVLVGDGMADRPLKKLGYKTCLQKARTPNMDRLAAEGEVGKARTVPKGLDPGSDVANLSILGYDPSIYYSGRAPIEAEYRRIKLGPGDVAFRCNLVTLDLADSENIDNAVMQDYSAGHISTKEAQLLIRDLNKKLGSKDISFYPGMSYRHLMIWKNGKEKMRCTPPHDISGKKIGGHLPEGNGAETLLSLMHSSMDFLMSHPVNQKRIRAGHNPANSIWLWGQGRKLTVPAFKEKYNLKGALISAVDLTKGLGICTGFDILNVKGATGYIDTNYIGKAKAALRALKKYDMVYVHVEAPDEAGHNGDLKAKMQAIEDFDKKVVGTIFKGIKKFGDCSILLMPDHFTPISVKTHTEEPVPFVIYRSRGLSGKPKAKARAYSESICRMKNILVFDKGHKLMDYFVKGKNTK
ncbi:MAG: cofactor-independent phosphoglycerate mutase [Nitrospirae bacterium]|nr:cofactor-independent phosphoglycerate mutase [Nitrospirota bacterium]